MLAWSMPMSRCRVPSMRTPRNDPASVCVVIAAGTSVSDTRTSPITQVIVSSVPVYLMPLAARTTLRRPSHPARYWPVNSRLPSGPIAVTRTCWSEVAMPVTSTPRSTRAPVSIACSSSSSSVRTWGMNSTNGKSESSPVRSSRLSSMA